MKTYLKQFLPPHKITDSDTSEFDLHGFKFRLSKIAVALDDQTQLFGIASTGRAAANQCLKQYAISLHHPEVIEGPKYRYCGTNGFALHPDFDMASQNAWLELVKRNEILKSWYFNTPVIKLAFFSDEEFSNGMRRKYKFIMVDFSTIPGLHVLGLFAFPKSSKMKLVYGFGCDENLALATKKAKDDFIIQLGAPLTENPDKKSPLFHHSFYHRPENLIHIQEWIMEHEYEKQNCDNFRLEKSRYQDYTPEDWKGKMSVVKCHCTDMIPLFHGEAPMEIFDFKFRHDIPHPISSR